MLLFKKFLEFFSPLTNFIVDLLGNEKEFTATDKNSAVVSSKTVGSFTTNISMYLADDVGWVNWASRFTAFHLQPKWYGKDTVLMMKQNMVSSNDIQFWAFDPEFYRLNGGSPIFEELNCPYQTVCLVMAVWQKSAWHIERVMFTTRGNQLPLRVT
ncbi:hypothetical protein DSO57_1007004 [Entomophthora muscae]|uniref:Uncharacterized protein n=1 Tax=Entomophthora muscae TaxID=34485 RepID=A0ACC2USG5_9FUNG|nr:hypothetical protein DSO57_1007004 [Entomophthora muscae]